MHENGLAVGRPLPGEALVRRAAVEIAVDEIRNDFDGALDVELFQSLTQQIARNRSDAVALLDGKFGDGEIAAVAADQSDVRAVKGGDERQAARRRHRAREQRADGMRNGVMDVEKIKRFRFENFEHFRGKRQCVRGMIEKRVSHDLYFVKMNAVGIRVQANGRGVADEVDLVPASGQLDAKLGGHDAGAAVSGVARDADAHGMSYKSVVSSEC